MRQLEEALRFALSFSESTHNQIVFQTTDDGGYNDAFFVEELELVPNEAIPDIK